MGVTTDIHPCWHLLIHANLMEECFVYTFYNKLMLYKIITWQYVVNCFQSWPHSTSNLTGPSAMSLCSFSIKNWSWFLFPLNLGWCSDLSWLLDLDLKTPGNFHFHFHGIQLPFKFRLDNWMTRDDVERERPSQPSAISTIPAKVPDTQVRSSQILSPHLSFQLNATAWWSQSILYTEIISACYFKPPTCGYFVI